MNRYLKAIALAIASFPVLAATSSGGEPGEYALAIEQQPLGSALQEFAKQSGVQVIFFSQVTEGHEAPVVKGRFTAADALTRLLNDSQLTFRELNPRTIEVHPLATVNSLGQSASNLYSDALGMSLSGTSEGDNPNPSPGTEEGGTAKRGMRSSQVQPGENKQNTDSSVTTEKSTDQESLEEIVVTGTRIRGTKDLPAPSISITREEILQSGASTVESVMANLPQNFSEVTPQAFMADEGGSRLAVSNLDRASGVDLRGLGSQSTLTLLNGTRRAGAVAGRVVDISVIPLSAIEKIEVVSGGHSAIYGSDAVGGVVNFITRRDFSGAETSAMFGYADDGAELTQISQTFGGDYEHAGFVVAYDYQHQEPLDLLETGLVLSPTTDGRIPVRRDVNPESTRHSTYLAGRWAPSDRVEFHVDGLYAARDNEIVNRELRPGATNESFDINSNSSDQYGLSAGAQIQVGNTWSADISSNFSVAENAFSQDGFLDFGFFSFEIDTTIDNRATLYSVSAAVEGPLPSIYGVTPRLAFGAETRREDFESVFNGVTDRTGDRDIRSVFAELLAPLSGGEGSRGTGRFELSLAGRYDDYSDFGDTFNPTGGIVWKPLRDITLKATYATAFRAPALAELGSFSFGFLIDNADPSAGGAISPVLVLGGDNAGLGPEEAETWSVAIDYKPSFAPWADFSLTYFNVDYQDRIDVPAVSFLDLLLLLEREDRYGDLLNRSPTAAEISAILASDTDGFIDNLTGTPWDPANQDILDAFPNLIVFDNRTANISIENVRAVDFLFNASVGTETGTLDLGLNVTYSIAHERSVTTQSPPFNAIDEVGKPVQFRARANAGWKQGAFGSYAYVNFLKGYYNPFSNPVSKIDSWTTVDVTFMYEAGHSVSEFFDGLTIALSAQNVFNEDPPEFLNSSNGLLYDPANASSLGRFVSLQITKKW